MRAGLLLALLVLTLGCTSSATPPADPSSETHPAVGTPAPASLPTMDGAAVFGRWYEPIEANLFVAPRASKLYIAWALPRDLMPLGAVDSPEEVEPFLVNSAWALCRRFDARATEQQTDCLVHLLRLQSNDEYTKSAAGGFSTVGKIETSRASAMAAETESVVAEPRSAVRARFARIDLQLAGFDPEQARAAAAAQAPAGVIRGGS